MDTATINESTESWHDDEGRLHRVDGPAVTYKDGSCSWWLHGKRHREGGPAIEELKVGVCAYYFEGKLHREDGPAIIDSKGKEWFLHGVRMTEKEYNTRTLTVDQYCDILEKL